jgi:dTDP-4-dehydrorhamnose reductase
MKTIAITSPTSMLGSMLYSVLKGKYQLRLLCKSEEEKRILQDAYGKAENCTFIAYDLKGLLQDYTEGFATMTLGPKALQLIKAIDDVDAIVNCTSVVKPNLLNNVAETFFMNAGLPHLLSRMFGSRLIHISTDCVFDGYEGAPYTENSRVNPTDFYGFTRSLGEPSDYSFVIRTSTIGPEICDSHSLIAWVQAQEGKSIEGFTKQQWNGVTTKQLAKSIDRIIQKRENFPTHGVFHVFGTDMSKFDLITALAKKYEVNVNILPNDIPVIDRRLRSVHNVNQQLQVPSLNDMLNDI